MTNTYLRIFDTTVAREDPRQCEFISVPMSNDIAGYVIKMANRNNSSPSDIRMYAYPTKKEWEKAQADNLKDINWSLMGMPIRKK